MSNESNARPLIIKRKKVSGGDGHHGGAWKVAMVSFPLLRRRWFRARGDWVRSTPSRVILISAALDPGRATGVVRARPCAPFLKKGLTRPAHLGIIWGKLFRTSQPSAPTGRQRRDRSRPRVTDDRKRPDTSYVVSRAR